MLDVGLLLAAILSLGALLMRAWNKRPIKTQIDRLDPPVRPRPPTPERPDVSRIQEDNQRTRDRLRALRARSERLRADLDDVRRRDRED